MSEEIARLFVTISADVSGLNTALLSSRTALEALQAQGGLLGRLPAQTEQQAREIVAGVQRGLAPLPGALRAGLEIPVQASLDALGGIVTGRVNAIIDQINKAIDQINGLLANMPSLGNPSGGGQAIQGRAAGGSVQTGKTYLIGERGPELLSIGSSGSVIPNHAIGGEGGMSIRGGTFHIYGVVDAEALYDQLQQVASRR